MTIPSKCRSVWLMGVALCVLARVSHAQEPTETSDVRLRNNCRLAVQALTTGRPAPHYDWALDQIRACDETGGIGLAGAWQSVAEDTVDLERLVFSSARLRDARVLEAVLAVAQDPKRTTAVRLSSLRVLASYADSTVSVSLGELQAPPDTAILPGIFDFGAHDGSMPLQSADPGRILSVFDTLATTDHDPHVRAAARFLRDGFALRRRVRQ